MDTGCSNTLYIVSKPKVHNIHSGFKNDKPNIITSLSLYMYGNLILASSA